MSYGNNFTVIVNNVKLLSYDSCKENDFHPRLQVKKVIGTKKY